MAPAVSELSPSSPPPSPVDDGPTIPGAVTLSGLWVGSAGAGELAFDLEVSDSGVVRGVSKLREAGELVDGVVRGRVSLVSSDKWTIELQITGAGRTTAYSGRIEDGRASGRMYVAGKAVGRWSAAR